VRNPGRNRAPEAFLKAGGGIAQLEAPGAPLSSKKYPVRGTGRTATMTRNGAPQHAREKTTLALRGSPAR
jgi:hypothetical protein